MPVRRVGSGPQSRTALGPEQAGRHALGVRAGATADPESNCGAGSKSGEVRLQVGGSSAAEALDLRGCHRTQEQVNHLQSTRREPRRWRETGEKGRAPSRRTETEGRRREQEQGLPEVTPVRAQ